MQRNRPALRGLHERLAPEMLNPHPDWLVPDWPMAGVRALMTTRSGGAGAAPFNTMNLRDGLGDDPATVAANQATLARAIGARPVYLNQVHGARVVRIGREGAVRAAVGAHTNDAAAEADASITNEPGVPCAVQVADCLPVLFAASTGNAVGAAHAGWRGLAAGVLEATVNALCEATKGPPAELHAWLGPCIGPRQFEVGADVLEAFGVANGRARGAHVAERFQPHKPGKWLADLPGLARDRLRACGVVQVHGGRWCTVEQRSRFFSFRRDGVTGRMVAAVWIRGRG